MKHRSSCLALALVACVFTERPTSGTPNAPPPPPRLFSQLEPAPSGALLRVFVDPARIVGWIAGSASYAHRTARIRLGATDREVSIDADNTFAWPYRVAARTEAVVRVGALEQRITLEPPPADESTAYFVVDRPAYRPDGKLAFTAFLRDGRREPLAGARVEVRLASETRHLLAAKLALVSDANGRITGGYTFSPADPLDDYTLSIPAFRGSARVALGELRKPKVKLEVDASVAPRTTSITFRALDFLDQPVPGGQVQFTAQIVREDVEPAPALARDGFMLGAPITGLGRDEALAITADPDAGVPWRAARQVVREVKGTVPLDRFGRGSHAIAVAGDWLRGHHRLLVDAVIVDAAGREQRATRTIPLERRDVRVQLAAPHELAAAGDPIDVSIRVVDAAGRPVAATTTLVAMRAGARADPYPSWSGNLPWNSNNLDWIQTPNGRPGCIATNAGCWSWRRGRTAPILGDTGETIAAAIPVTGDTARLVLDDPGAYRLHAVARLGDGSSVWSDLGLAVRERDALPPVVLELDRAAVRQGDRITGRLAARYRDARALVVIRDATAIRARRLVVLDAGEARIDLPAGPDLGYGASIEAYVLGDGGEVHAAQQLIEVAPASRMLAIRTHTNDRYGPGDTVELDIDVGRAEAVDLVVSVHDQSLLAVAPDRSVDPASFYFADDRVRSRPALAILRAQLGDVTIGELVGRARSLIAGQDPALDRVDATQVIALVDQRALNLQSVSALLRFAGVHAVAGGWGYGSYMTLDDPQRRRLAATRVIDFLETDAKTVTLDWIAGAVIVGDPGRRTTAAAMAQSFAGVSGNASFSAPVSAGPAPLDAADRGGNDIVRRDFSDSAYWNGLARTGADGKARVRFKLPDSLTTWQVVVTAVSRDLHVGRAVSILRTVRDVMVWPMLPRLFTEGDTVSISGAVHNQTELDRDIVVSIRADHAEVLSPAQVTVRVPRGKSVPVTWSLRTPERGMASLVMTATAIGGGADASEKHIPVVASSAEQVTTASGFAAGPLTVELPAGVDPRDAHLELTFAPSLAADLASTLDYLVEYPYGCAEQTMSRFVPAIRVAGILGNLGVRDGALAARLPAIVEAGLKRLAQLQQPDGGWGWQGGSATHEMITPYVLWGLLEAQRAGYTLLDDAVIERGMARVKTFLDQLPGSQLSDRAYLLSVLARRERLPDAWWSSFVARRDEMSDYALALTLEIADARGDRATAERVVGQLHARVSRGGGWAQWKTAGFSRWMEDPFEVTAAVMKALVGHDPGDPLLPEIVAYFVAHKHGDRWNSTKDTAMVLFAMTEYLAKTHLAVSRDPSVGYTINGGAPARLAFPDGRARTIHLDGRQLQRRTTVAFSAASPGMLARAVLRYRRSGRDLAPAAYGLEVTRSLYLLGDRGARLRELATGDRVPRGAYIESVVTVHHAANEAMRYLLVEDPKPAGAEALPDADPRFPRTGHSWVLREDREARLAYHHEEAPPTVTTRSILHLEVAGELAIPPAQAELMYQTHTRGNSGSVVLRVD